MVNNLKIAQYSIAQLILVKISFIEGFGIERFKVLYFY